MPVSSLHDVLKRLVRRPHDVLKRLVRMLHDVLIS